MDRGNKSSEMMCQLCRFWIFIKNSREIMINNGYNNCFGSEEKFAEFARIGDGQ
jgi:hypothetical protein